MSGCPVNILAPCRGHQETPSHAIVDTRYTRNTNLLWSRKSRYYLLASHITKYPLFIIPMSLFSIMLNWSLPCLSACCCHVSTRTPGHVNMRTRQYFAIQYPHHMHTLFSSVNTYLKVEIQCFRYFLYIDSWTRLNLAAVRGLDEMLAANVMLM